VSAIEGREATGAALRPHPRYSARPDAVRLTLTELLILFAIGAAGGLVGDAAHVDAGTTRYLDDSLPFVWNSALWFPILVGIATAAVGELRLRLGPCGAALPLRQAAAAIAAVLAIYAITALVYAEPEGAATTLVLMLAVLVVCWLADGWPAVVCGITAAIVGPAAEIVVVELELTEYAESSDSLFGVALWLPALYLAFGVVAARLAELLVARRRARPRPHQAPASAVTNPSSSSPE
jgi:hypothetical protein